jgi:tripartite-type tricarboxylate transporter receptor subunit TctC
MWNQQVVVENRPGAGGNIGADVVAKAAPDGYTLLMASPAEVAINPHIFPTMPFDPIKDLAPVSKVATAPLVLVVNPAVPVHSVAELITYAKARNGQLDYASSGTGGPQHLAAERLKMDTGIKMTHVPYKGGAPAITDLLGGQVQLFFSGVPPALGQIKAGKLRALAVTSRNRFALMPDVPTMIEGGVANFVVDNWQGIFAPAKTPAPVIDQLNRDINTVLKDPEFRQSLAPQGAEPSGGSVAQFKAFVADEDRSYAQLIKAAGVRAD